MPRITDFDAAGTLAGGEHIHLVQPSSTVTITATTISAQASDNSFNDSGSGFAFAVGDRVVASGFPDAGTNLEIGVITSATASKIIIGGTDGDAIVDQAEGSTVTISKLVSRRATAQEIADLGGGGGGGGISPATNEAASRALETAYTNSSGAAMLVIVNLLGNNDANLSHFSFDIASNPASPTWEQVSIARTYASDNNCMVIGFVPDGYAYRVTRSVGGNTAAAISQWLEQVQG